MICGWIVGIIAIAVVSHRAGVIDRKNGIPWYQGFPAALAVNGSVFYAAVQVGTLVGLP